MNKKSMWGKNFKISIHGTWNPAIGSSFGVQPKNLEDCLCQIIQDTGPSCVLRQHISHDLFYFFSSKTFWFFLRCILFLSGYSLLKHCASCQLKVVKVVLWSKNHFLFSFRFWKHVPLIPNWQSFKLWVLSKGCLFWV